MASDNKFEKAAMGLELNAAKQQLNLLRRYLDTRIADRRMEINRKLDSKILAILADGVPVRNFARRLARAIDLDKFRPHDMSIYDFAMSPDLWYVGGEFSTFDIEMSKLSRRTDVDPMDLQKSINKTVRNADNVVKQYVADIMQIIGNNMDLVADAMNAGIARHYYAWEDLLQTIADALCAKMGIAERVDVCVVSSLWRLRKCGYETDREDVGIYYVWADDENKIHNEILIGAVDTLRDYIELPDLRSWFLNKMIGRALTRHDEHKIDLFIAMISNFAHEFGHFVDHVKTRSGMLGAQKYAIADSIYETAATGGHDTYKANPKEFSSTQIENAIKKHLGELNGRK